VTTVAPVGVEEPPAEPRAEEGPAARVSWPGWRRPRGRTVTIACILAYAALAILVFAPASPLATGSLPTAGNYNPAGSDAFQMTWFLAYAPHALAHGLDLFHTDLIFYPSGVNLADNTAEPLLGLLAAPITLTLGPVATFNLLVRLAFALSATSMYLVLGRWCSSRAARFVGGLLYGFGPYMACQALHLDLVFVPIPPLLVLLGDELLRRRRMRPALLGLAIGACVAAQYLISPDVLSGCAVMAVIVIGWLAVRHRDAVRPLLPYVVRAGTVAAGVFAVLAGYPIYEMLAGPGHLTGPVLQVATLQGDSSDLLSPVVPTSTQLLTPPFLSHLGDNLVSSNLSESGGYLGIPLIALLVAIVRRLRHDADVALFAMAAVAALVMSFGGHLVIATWRSPFPLPGDVSAHLPLLENTIPARYALYVLLFVSMIVAIGIERIWLASRAERSGPAGRPARRRIAAVGALVVLCLLPDAPFKSAALSWSPSLPATVERLTPPGGVVVTDPPTELDHAGAMTWQAIDGMSFRLVGGYANIPTPGEPYGQKWVEAPPFLAVMPENPSAQPAFAGTPALRGAIAFVDYEEAELRSYLTANSATTFVFTDPDAPRDGSDTIGYDPAFTLPPATYWFVTAALGPPQVVAPGYVIWVAGSRGWQRRPAA
jgi:hypothetical protein